MSIKGMREISIGIGEATKEYKKEINRLRGIIEKLYKEKIARHGGTNARSRELNWQQFQTDNQL